MASPDLVFASSAELVAALAPVEPVYCIYPRVLTAVVADCLGGFPGRVLYAVKANPEARVLRILQAAGVRHFDTASVPEMDRVHALCPEAGCYFMAPVKLPGAMATAYHSHGVRHCVIDHAEELARVLGEAPARELTIFVRLATPDAAATYDLSAKFGADPQAAAKLLRAVAAAGARPALAFNVGSLVRSPTAYAHAIERAAGVVGAAGVPIETLDVGGGFPCPYPEPESPPLAEFFAAIEAARSRWLPGVPLLAEPGRALVAAGMSLLARVLHRSRDRLFLNDGIWGSLVEAVLSKGLLRWPTRVFREAVPLSGATGSFTLFGPTCDSLDRLPAPYPLPRDIRAGDLIEFGMIGAYSLTNRTGFNGFYPEHFATVDGAGALPPGTVVPQRRVDATRQRPTAA